MGTVKDIIEKAYTKVNGEYEAVATSSDDFKTYLNVLNQVMETWAHTPYVKWQSLFDMTYQLSDVVAADTLHYAFPDMDRVVVGNTPLDYVYFVDDGVVIARYKMLDQALFQATSAKNVCMLASDGLHLKSVSEELIGTRIQLPAYLLPPEYSTPTQTVRIDSVPWLVASMAAFICDASPVPFIARNAEKFNKEAAIYMKTMRDNNRHSQMLSIKGPGSGSTITSLSQAIEAGVGIGGGSFDIIDGGEA